MRPRDARRDRQARPDRGRRREVAVDAAGRAAARRVVVEHALYGRAIGQRIAAGTSTMRVQPVGSGPASHGSAPAGAASSRPAASTRCARGAHRTNRDCRCRTPGSNTAARSLADVTPSHCASVAAYWSTPMRNHLARATGCSARSGAGQETADRSAAVAVGISAIDRAARDELHAAQPWSGRGEFDCSVRPNSDVENSVTSFCASTSVGASADQNAATASDRSRAEDSHARRP